jgi:hypothetical protein
VTRLHRQCPVEQEHASFVHGRPCIGAGSCSAEGLRGFACHLASPRLAVPPAPTSSLCRSRLRWPPAPGIHATGGHRHSRATEGHDSHTCGQPNRLWITRPVVDLQRASLSVPAGSVEIGGPPGSMKGPFARLRQVDRAAVGVLGRDCRWSSLGWKLGPEANRPPILISGGDHYP